MTTTFERRSDGPAAPTSRSREDHHRFAGRVKRSSLALAVAAFGLGWGLVSQNVVGATNAAPAQPATNPAANNPVANPGTNAATTPHRAVAPSADFFGAPASQPQPILGNGGGGGGVQQAPVVRGGTS